MARRKPTGQQMLNSIPEDVKERVEITAPTNMYGTYQTGRTAAIKQVAQGLNATHASSQSTMYHPPHSQGQMQRVAQAAPRAFKRQVTKAVGSVAPTRGGGPKGTGSPGGGSIGAPGIGAAKNKPAPKAPGGGRRPM